MKPMTTADVLKCARALARTPFNLQPDLVERFGIAWAAIYQTLGGKVAATHWSPPDAEYFYERAAHECYHGQSSAAATAPEDIDRLFARAIEMAASHEKGGFRGLVAGFLIMGLTSSISAQSIQMFRRDVRARNAAVTQRVRRPRPAVFARGAQGNLPARRANRGARLVRSRRSSRWMVVNA
jgi:hypothetical protein